jgi:methylthioribose-1-phosphate isomerase
MEVLGEHYRTIWLNDDNWSVTVIDQTRLPHHFQLTHLSSLADAIDAISNMVVRGAPLIGATAAYGICLGLHADASLESLRNAAKGLKAARPTAVNLQRVVDDMTSLLSPLPEYERCKVAYSFAAELCDADVKTCYQIGTHGLAIIEDQWRKAKNEGLQRLNILTHCNAGWLATVDWGTALAPVYMAHNSGVPIHIWVDETRPRNQGSHLTAWELAQQGIPHTIIVDNAGGHLMQLGEVDLCIVGTDRTTRSGDVCNKIGTYLKALAAYDNDIPFYVAVPESSIDWQISDGLLEIPIEERDGREVSHIQGQAENGELQEISILGSESNISNYGFDVTPSHLVSGLISERGLCEASSYGLRSLFPERFPDYA